MKYTAISLLSALATFAAAAPTSNAQAVEVRGEATTSNYGSDGHGGKDISGTVGDTVNGAFGIAGEWVKLVENLITGGHGKGPGYGGGYNGGYDGNGGYNGDGGYNGGKPVTNATACTRG